MTTKHTKHVPATPLPWDFKPDETITDNPYWSHGKLWHGSVGVAEIQLHNRHSQGLNNAAYIAHAANAYPRLVEDAQYALHMLTGLNCPFGKPFAPRSDECQCNYHEWYHGRLAILRELGEAE